MKRTEEDLESYKKTVKKIFQMAEEFKSDLRPYFSWSPKEIYNLVSNLPFVEDPPNEETLSRPAFTLDAKYSPRDCDDKSLILGAYANLKKIPWRLCVIGERTRPHHIYPDFYLAGRWISFDATFPGMEIGKLKYKENFKEIFYYKKPTP